MLRDWRIHPALVARVVAGVLLPAARRGLDVGAGRHLTQSEWLLALGPTRDVSWAAIDVRHPLVRVPSLLTMRADARKLPFGDEAFDVVVRRMLLGAPISQKARREGARVSRARSDGFHAEGALQLEAQIWRELYRVTSPGGWHVHHSLERVLYARPEVEGFVVHWPLLPHVPLPPQPYQSYPRETLHFHLSGITILQKIPHRALESQGARI
jgi:hypothetical protein